MFTIAKRLVGTLVVMYRQWPSTLPHTVVWTAEPERDESHRVLPDGCMDLIWYDDHIIVAGPDTSAVVAAWRPGRRYVGLRFAAGVGPKVLGVPGHVVRNQRLGLSEVWPRVLSARLHEQLHVAATPVSVLEAAAWQALRRAEPPDPLGGYLVGQLGQSERVSAIAGDVGLSVRQLHRRSLEMFGYGPKTLARILRLNRAVDLARGRVELSDVAMRAGYADQAHMAREVRALAGVSMTLLLD